jgi:hypothetical protein
MYACNILHCWAKQSQRYQPKNKSGTVVLVANSYYLLTLLVLSEESLSVTEITTHATLRVVVVDRQSQSGQLHLGAYLALHIEPAYFPLKRLWSPRGCIIVFGSGTYNPMPLSVMCADCSAAWPSTVSHRLPVQLMRGSQLYQSLPRDRKRRLKLWRADFGD